MNTGREGFTWRQERVRIHCKGGVTTRASLEQRWTWRRQTSGGQMEQVVIGRTGRNRDQGIDDFVTFWKQQVVLEQCKG